MQSVSSEQVRSVADTRGKHRISAELKRLEQEACFLDNTDPRRCYMEEEEELEQLEKMEKASTSCKEMLNKVETRPDPLLAIIIGPVNPSWDRWFEGQQENSGCRCWIL